MIPAAAATSEASLTGVVEGTTSGGTTECLLTPGPTGPTRIMTLTDAVVDGQRYQIQVSLAGEADEPGPHRLSIRRSGATVYLRMPDGAPWVSTGGKVTLSSDRTRAKYRAHLASADRRAPGRIRATGTVACSEVEDRTGSSSR